MDTVPVDGHRQDAKASGRTGLDSVVGEEMSHYRVTLIKKSRAGTEVLKTFHKSNPRVEPGMVQAIARDHSKFVTIRVCFLDDAECPGFLPVAKGPSVPIPAIPQGEA